MKKRNVGIFIFDNVEVLDFAGPFEVFSRTRLDEGAAARRTEDSAPFHVFTVAAKPGDVSATGGLRIVPHHSFENHPPIDILVIPGGFGTRPLLEDAPTREWIQTTAAAAELVTSVCTGALLLGTAGLLQGKRATTHWAALDELEKIPGVTVERESRVVHDGVVTSGGVASGIDMSFEVVESLHGADVANETAKYIEYRRVRADS